jgi:Tol biopolymer transport system component
MANRRVNNEGESVGMKRKGNLLISFGLFFLVQAGGICWSQTTTRVSVDSAGGDSNGVSNSSSISSDGRYVAFKSFATDLVTGGTDGNADIFVRDRQTGTTTIVSVHSDGTEGDLNSNSPSISGDGRYVAFMSDAPNLVDNDTNDWSDIFVRDRDADGNGTYDEPGPVGVSTLRVSVYSDGTESIDPSFNPSISGDGRYVAFDSDGDLVAGDSGNYYDIFVRDLLAGTTTRVSVDSDGNEGSGHSYSPSISGDGRYVAFESFATNLVAGGTNGNAHVFVHDRQTGITTIVSVHSDGTEGDHDSSSPSISGDGRYVAFQSQADNLVGGDTNLFPLSDIFVHDLQTGITTLVSVDSTGIQGNGDSSAPSISADGRYVAFESFATNLLAGGTNGNAHVFVRDRQTGITTIVSVDSLGTEGNGDSLAPSISSDGKYVAFESDANNLVTADDNGIFDIFSYERESLPPTVDSTSPAHNANDVAVGAAIAATFSEPMNGSTIDVNTFTLNNGVTGTVTYDANSTTATFTPTNNLDYDTTYTATITTAAEDLAGNPMQADYIWSFTTQSEKNNSGGRGPCFIAAAASD